MKTGIQLIGIKVCPYVERIRLTFGYKNLQYSYKVISPLEQKSEEFTKISPYNRVPVIVLPDNTSVYESAAIFQYLDEQYPEKKLLDGTPFEKAHQRIWTHFCNTKLSTSLYQYMFEHKSKEEFEADLKFLENYLKTSSGEFFFNDKVSMCDVMFYPFFHRFQLLPSFEMSKYPNISKIFKNLEKQAWLKESSPSIELIKEVYDPFIHQHKKNPYKTEWKFY